MPTQNWRSAASTDPRTAGRPAGPETLQICPARAAADAADPPTPSRMKMNAARNVLLCTLAAATAGSCVEITELPLGGTYRAQVDSPFNIEGGALLELIGPGIEGVSAPGAVLVTRVIGDTTRILIMNNPLDLATAPPLAFELQMAEGVSVPEGRVLQVIARNNQVRDFIAGYEIRFSR